MEKQMLAIERLKRIAEIWYLREPAFFAVYCIQELRENNIMQCAMRCGKGRVEYNSSFINDLTDKQLEELFKVELLRLILKHPYQRRPVNCPNEKMVAASDMTLHGQYTFDEYCLVSPKLFDLEEGKHYEWYLANIPLQEDNSGDGNDDDEHQPHNSDDSSGADNGDSNNSVYNTNVPGAMSDRAVLWEEDDELCDRINNTIEQIESSGNWGSIPGQLKEKIVASTKAKIDYNKILSGFRASVISSRRSLTRMRPNRRFDFQQMGSRYELATKLLIALDTSASVKTKQLQNFLGVMQRMFNYGISQIDVILFDCELQTAKPMTFSNAKKLKKMEMTGRGGTDFQVAIDYLKKNNFYDGMAIFTDGDAPVPQIDFITHTKFVWVLTDEKQYEKHNVWMKKFGRVCFMY